MNKQKVLEVYHQFWYEFRRLCTAAGCTCKPNSDSKIELEAVHQDFIIKTFCYFPDWRYKVSYTSERVHILLQSSETYSRRNDRMSQSNVRVLYLRVSGTTAQSLLALHYDFVSPIQSAHPVFHAQFGTGEFPSKDLEDVGFRATIEPPPVGTLYSSVRIPTPCMSFGSVLLGLAADHLEAPVFGKILKLVRTSKLSTWNAACESLENSLHDGNYLPSHHWYELPH
jgi:hypothetical protein